MKKIFLALMAIAAICLTSCEERITGVTIDAGIADPATSDGIIEDHAAVTDLSTVLDAVENTFQNEFNKGRTQIFITDRSELVYPYYSSMVISGANMRGLGIRIRTLMGLAVLEAAAQIMDNSPSYYPGFTFRVKYSLTLTGESYTFDIPLQGWGSKEP